MIFRRFWNDEAAIIDAVQLILLTTLLVIGVLVGLQTVRDSIAQEFGDVADALENLNQSYSFSIVTGSGGVFKTSSFTDFVDVTTPVSASQVGCTSVGMDVPATHESADGSTPARIGFEPASHEQ